MKFKKIVCIVMISVFLLGNKVLADDLDNLDENNGMIDEEILSVSSNTTEEPKTYSKHIICMERTTGEVLYEKNAYEKTAMASTTKIMTAIIVLENSDLNEEVEISSKAAGTGGSTLGITTGSKMTMESLLYGLLLRSGNDCAVAIAEHIGGDITNFAKIMNDKAKDLGLKNTNFVTPHGLDDENHYTTAYDLALLTNYALENDTFKKIVGTKQISISINNSYKTLTNTNELLGNVDGVYGVKTGFTGNAGRCLVTACKRNNMDIIVVVLGADTKKIRGLDSKNVIEYVYNNFEMINTKEILEENFKMFCNSQTIDVYKSEEKISMKHIDNYIYVYPVNKNKISSLKTSIYCLPVVNAPVCKNEKIGVIHLNCDNKILFSVDIVSNTYIPRTNWQEYFKLFLINFNQYYKF